MIKRRLNCLPSKKNPEARQYHQLMLGAATLPPSADLRPFNPPIFDQGSQGSCTAHAGARAQGILQNMALAKKISVPGLLFNPAQYTPVSRDAIYAWERMTDGDLSQDAGSSLSTFVQVAESYGFCEESLWPYSDQAMYTEPSAEAVAQAAQHKILQAYQINDLYHMKHALAMGYPFVFGITCYDSFLGQQTALSGNVPMPDLSSESPQGGHALCMVGYSDARQAFLLANSWGTSWGMQGYAWIPYAYMTNPQLASDMQVLLVQP